MVLRPALFLFALCGPGIALAAQPPGVPAQSPAPSATSPSAALRPSLDILKQAVAGMRIDRWKASAAIKNEAQSNLDSVQRDLQATLPSLLAAADAAPSSPAKTLPVYRNVDALYDVILRLDAAARLAAPADQMSAIDQSLASLSDARHALGDELQKNTEAQEGRVVHLEAALKAVPPPQPPPPPTTAPVKCPTTPAKKRKVTPTAAKPGTPTASSPTPSN